MYVWPVSASLSLCYHRMVFFIIRLMEGIVDMFMSRVPFYREIKLAFITWLVLPKFKVRVTSILPYAE